MRPGLRTNLLLGLPTHYQEVRDRYAITYRFEEDALVDLTGQLSNPQPLLRHLLDQGILAIGELPPDDQHPPKPTSRPKFQTQRRLKPDQIAELAEAYRSGETMKDLASTFGIHRTTVTAQLRAHGVALRGLSEDEAVEASRLYKDGWPSRQLAEKFGVSPNTILRSLRRAGVSIRPRPGGSPSRATP